MTTTTRFYGTFAKTTGTCRPALDVLFLVATETEALPVQRRMDARGSFAQSACGSYVSPAAKRGGNTTPRCARGMVSL